MAMHSSLSGAPFGGIGNSGTGYAHGKDGFDTFTHRRTIAASELPQGGGVIFAPATVTSKELAESLQKAVAGKLLEIEKELAAAT
jgi:coniferyl-aldehyde dehydrogenase